MGSRITPQTLEPSNIAPGVPTERVWFAEEILPHEPALRAWLRVRFPSLSESDDIVQESYFRLIRTQAHRKVANAKSYLFMIARNVAFDLFRRNRATPMIPATESERASVMEDRDGVVEAVCSSQEFEILREAINSLPERCRRIMRLQKLQGLSNLEIAGQLGLSVNTVNAQLVIGLARCRKYLLARGVLRGRRP